MHEQILEAVIDELRVGQCMRDIARYWQFRSTVPGPGMRAASEFLCARHGENGVEARVIAYPADDQTEWLDGRKNPLEWVPRAARLEVVMEERGSELVCDYADEPLCLVSNSTGTPAGGTEAPLVEVFDADREEGYAGKDVRDKILLTDLPSMSVERQARRQGAIGVVSDCVCPPWLASHPPVREPADVPDLTMWSVFQGRRSDCGLWGFNLTPRQGARLRRSIRESAGPVRLRATVDADLVEGTSEVVDALVPGTDLADEEIWVLAHSSEPGARDNASGCCLGVELARILNVLGKSGNLSPLRRSVRFLNGVEVSGFLPYIHARQDRLGQVVAGLCLDSVGMDFRKCGGEFLLFRSPEANASFVDGLMEQLFETVAAEPNSRFSSDNYDLFVWNRSPFWGNDAFVSEGYFDIPTPQISCWPDKYYHSSMDTVDQLSPNSLGRSGVIAATYLYLLAAAGPREALWCAGLAARDWKGRIVEALSDEAVKTGRRNADADYLRGLGRHLGFQGGDAVRQVLRLAPEDEELQQGVARIADELGNFACRESEDAMELAAGLAGETAHPAAEIPESEPDGRVIKRLRWSRPYEYAFSEERREKVVELRQRNGNVERAWEWLNGRRSVGEIWERLQFGGEVDMGTVIDYLDLLVAAGFAVQVEPG